MVYYKLDLIYQINTSSRAVASLSYLVFALIGAASAISVDSMGFSGVRAGRPVNTKS